MKSGVQALGYLKNNPAPELILLDFSMPATSGTDVLKALQSDEKFKDIPVIFLTSNSDDKLKIVDGLLSGAVDSIDKPVNPALPKLRYFKTPVKTSPCANGLQN